MAKVKNKGYWFCFGEVLFASIKSMVIIGIVTTFQISFLLSSDSLMASLLATVAMTLIGMLLFSPFLIIFVLAYGAPVAVYLVRKGNKNIWWWLLNGLIGGLIFFSILLFSGEKPTEVKTLLGNSYILMSGLMTGYFSYKQIFYSKIQTQGLENDQIFLSRRTYIDQSANETDR